MKSKEYTYNVYVSEGVVRLSAYELKYLDNPKKREPAETNTERFHTLGIPMDTLFHEELAYLLGDPDWSLATDKWQDYDSWEGGKKWYNGIPTERLKQWIDGLPEYEPAPAHEWTTTSTEALDELARSTTERPIYTDINCKNCEATYRIGKVW